MGSLKDLYFRIEDKYYDLLDWMDSKGLPVYRLVDVFERRHVPSFPVAVAGCIIVALLLWMFISGAFALSSLTVFVQDEDGGALGGATVTVSWDGIAAPLIGETDDLGRVPAFAVPLGMRLSISASATGYDSDGSEFTALSSEESHTFTLATTITTLTRTINLLHSGTSEYVYDYVSVGFTCSENSGYSATAGTDNGEILLDTVPSDCGTLYATPGNGYTTVQAGFDVGDSGAYNLLLDEPVDGAGTVDVYVADAQGVALSGALVTLTTAGGAAVETKPTLGGGSATFNNVPAGSYYVLVYDPQGNYAEYNSAATGEIKDLFASGTATFYVTLSESVVGEIKILTRDMGTMLPVRNAEVTLSKDGIEVSPQSTDDAGKAEFGVGENVEYEVRIDHPEYLVTERSGIYPAADYTEILLTPATIENSQSLAVMVVDERAKPVEGARLRLKKLSDGMPISDELITGTSGSITFHRIPEGAYYVYAYKPGYGEENSDPVTVSAREANTIEIILPIGDGMLSVSVVDEQKQPLAGAVIKIIDMFTRQMISEEMTTASGIKEFTVRADKTVYAVASAPGKMQYTTAPVQMVKDATKSIEVALVRSVPTLGVELLDLYYGEEAARDALNPGQRYTAKLLLKIPANTAFDTAGVHFRTGSDDSDVMERDYIYIDGITSSAETILKGTSYTPDTGYAADSQHFTNGSAKWANLIFRNPGAGVFEVKAELQVSEAAPVGSMLELHYRGWGKTGGYVRFPADAILGSAESTAERQALYAHTKAQVFSVGAGMLCGEKFCTTVSIEDVAAGIKTAVFDEYPARVLADYKLRFYITGISTAVYADTELQVSTAASSVEFRGYEVLDVMGAKHTGSANAAELSVGVGSVGKDDAVQGIVDFVPQKEGASELVIALVSKSTKEKIMEKKVTLRVSAADEMDVEILPKMILPYVNNNLLIKATDAASGSPIFGATVEIIKDDVLLGSGNTDTAGVFAHVLFEPNAGSVVKVRVEKQGYATIEKEVRVTEDILLVTPPSVSESLNALLNEENLKRLVVANITEIPLVITDVQAIGGLLPYVDLAWQENYSGVELAMGADMNMDFVLKLTDRGRRVDEARTLAGGIAIRASSSAFGREWATTVPVEVRIVFGQQVDSEGCFSIEPDAWNVFTETTVRTLNAAVKNNCAVGGTEIALRDLGAKVVSGAENSLGEFEVSSDLEGSEPVVLSGEFQAVAGLVPAGAENSVTLKFKPADVSSAEGTPQIVFRAINKTASGDEELKESIAVSITINKLAECVEFINADNMVIESCPYNTGYGNYQNYLGGSYGGGQMGNYSGFYGGTGYDPYYSQQYPGMGRTWPNTFMNPMSYGRPNAPYIVPGMAAGPGAGAAEQPTIYLEADGDAGRIHAEVTGGQSAIYFQTPSWLVPATGMPGTSTMPFYGGDNYNPNYNGMWNCGERAFKIRNNCGSAVEIDLEAEPGVVVEKDKLKIEPAGEEEVTVQAAYLIGTYNITAKAKVAESKENAQAVRVIPVTIQSMFTSTYEDCIGVNPARTLQFNNFVAQPITIDIVNTCYPNVTLLPRADTIMFGTIGLAMPTQPAQSGIQDVIGDWRYRDQRIEGGGAGSGVQVLRFEVVKNPVYRDNVPEFPRAGPPMMQLGMLRYFLTAGNYAIEAPTTLTVKFQDPYGRVNYTTFDMIVQDLWAAGPYAGAALECYGDPGVNAAACANKDSLDITGALDGDCIQPGDFQYGVYRYNPGRYDRETILLAKPKGCGKTGGCGAVDRISNLRYSSLKQELKDQGIDLRLYTDGKRQNIYVKITALKGYKNKGLEVDGYVTATVSRVVPVDVDDVRIPVKFCIGPGVITPAEPGAATVSCDKASGCPTKQCLSALCLEGECEYVADLEQDGKPCTLAGGGSGVCSKGVCIAGEVKPVAPEACGGNRGITNEAAFKKYGFDRLLLEWRWGQVGDDACDVYEDDFGETLDDSDGQENYAFCDAAQATIALNKKMKKVQDIAALLISSGINEGSIMTANDLVNYVGETIEVTDHKLGGEPKLVFYVANETASAPLVENRLDSDALGIDPATITNIKITKNFDLIVKSWMPDAVLKALYENNEKAGKDVVAVIEADAKVNGYSGELEALGLEKKTINGKAYYVWTFNEYKAFHDKIVAAMNATTADAAGVPAQGKCDKANDAEVERCIITGVGDHSGNTIPVSTVMLKTLYVEGNIRFIASCRTDSTRDGCPKAGVCDEPGIEIKAKFRDVLGGSIKQFCEDNMNPYMYLMKDAYNEDFELDFGREYSGNGLVTKNAARLSDKAHAFRNTWIFIDSPKTTPGLYAVATGYHWGPEETGGAVNNPLRIEVAMTQASGIKSINAEYAKNPMFSLPFDGDVAKRGPRTRKGYGINYDAGFGGEKPYLAYYGAVDDSPQVFHVTDFADSFVKLKVNYHSAYEDTQSGTVARIASGAGTATFDYYPSDAVPISLNVKPPAGQNGVVFYSLTGPGLGSPPYVFDWSPSGKDGKQSVKGFCSDKTGQYFGITGLGSGVYSTMAYLPAGSGATPGVKNAALKVECKSGDLGGTYAYDRYASSPKSSLEADLSMELNHDKDRIQTKYNLKNLFMQIRDEYVCVNIPDAGDSLTLSWNPDKLYADAGIAK